MSIDPRTMKRTAGPLLAALAIGMTALAEAPPMPAFLNKVQLHNFDGFEPTPDGTGVTVYRLPAGVRAALSPEGARQVTHARSSEIRFVLNEGAKLEDVVIRLKSNRNTRVMVYRGDELHGVIGGLVARKGVELYIPPSLRGSYQPTNLDKTVEASIAPARMRGSPETAVAGEPAPPKRFPGHVHRIQFDSGVITLTGIEGDIRPPRTDEVPPVLVSYGTSISMGAAATRPDRSFTALTAQSLGYSLRNLGVSGNAFCEREMADYLAEQPAGLYLLEISVNMVGRDYSAGKGFAVEEFRARAGYMIDRIAGKNPGVPVVCVSVLPYRGGDADGAKPETRERAKAFRETLERLCKESKHKNVLFVSGPDLLSYGGLSEDGIHPSDQGMAEIASKLVPRIRAVLPSTPAQAPAPSKAPASE